MRSRSRSGSNSYSRGSNDAAALCVSSIDAQEEAATADASSSASVEPRPPEAEPKTKVSRRGKFHRAIYDRPIVLLGCSGSSDELGRLARGLSVKLNGGGGGNDKDEKAGVEANDKVIHATGTNSVGSYVYSPAKLHSQIASKAVSMSNGNVIVLDFNHPQYKAKAEEGDHAATLKKHMADLAKSLYEDEGLLSVYVNIDPKSSGMSEEGRDRREEMEKNVFVPYSDFEVVVADESGGKNEAWDDIEWELNRLVARATLPPAVPGSSMGQQEQFEGNTADLVMGSNTFFLSLSFPEIEQVQPYLPTMCQDVDAMEFRADLLDCRDDRFELMRSLQTLRRMCRPYAVRAPGLASPGGGNVIDDALPVVFTVRTAHQAGTYPDDAAGIERMFDILELGLRSAVEVLDVESAWDPKKTDALLKQAEDQYGGSTLILGSHHVVPDEVTMDDAIAFYRQCHLNGRSHGAKVVLSIEDESKDTMADDAGRIAQSLCRSEKKPVVPNISLILGEVGQYSRIINDRFTPVTHESLPFVAAPGQLTAAEIMKARVTMGHVTPRKYCILGHNIAYSVSPQMHNAAFGATKLPHTYSLVDVPTVEEFVASDLWNNDPTFGGCSVTVPHKEQIAQHLDQVSDSARAIGAVNTVVVREERDFNGSTRRVLFGDNTDWRGIYIPLSRRRGVVEREGVIEEEEDADSSSNDEVVGVALILGGGGTARAAAYAASKLGLERVYWNRTPGKAEVLAETFGGKVVPDLSEGELGHALAEMGGELRTIISTLPAGAEFELPSWLVEEGSGSCSAEAKAGPGKRTPPVILDVNYKPYRTRLLAQAENAGFDVVRGSEMLWEQGVGQFELWTGRTAPYRVMKDVVLENCMPQSKE